MDKLMTAIVSTIIYICAIVGGFLLGWGFRAFKLRQPAPNRHNGMPSFINRIIYSNFLARTEKEYMNREFGKPKSCVEPKKHTKPVLHTESPEKEVENGINKRFKLE